jgi:hypothetical protein
MNSQLNSAITRILACLGFLLFAAAPAKAIPSFPTTTYEFTGDCTDCAAHAGTPSFVVHGQLVLTDLYLLGTPLAPIDFVSFTYDGSNLLSAFTIDAADLESIIGVLPAKLPGPPTEDTFILTKSPFGPHNADGIVVQSNGFWAIGALSGDMGTNAVFSAVPEPSTWAMILLGFAGVGLTGYRRLRREAPAT